MRIRHRGRALLVYVFITIGIVFGVAPPAQAYSTTGFFACDNRTSWLCSNSLTQGSFTWYNRTAGVQGHVVNTGVGSTTAIFEAFAGSTKIDRETRTADDTTMYSGSDIPGDRPFSFTIGDANLVGGIDRIRVTVCLNSSGYTVCGDPRHFWRP